jgi:hypothetical protein
MGRNWVTDSYMNGGDRPSRYEKTSQRWRELEVRLQR